MHEVIISGFKAHSTVYLLKLMLQPVFIWIQFLILVQRALIEYIPKIN